LDIGGLRSLCLRGKEGRGKGRKREVKFPNLFNSTVTTYPHFQKPGTVMH